jgi:hypothetical protein
MKKISTICTVAIAVMFVVMASSAIVYSKVQDDDWSNDADVRTIDFGKGISLETANQLGERFYDVSVKSDEETITFKGTIDLAFMDGTISYMSLDPDNSIVAEISSSYNNRTGFMNTDAIVYDNGEIIDEDSLECSPIFYDDGTFDIFFTFNERIVSLLELIGQNGDKEDCFVPLIIAGVVILTATQTAIVLTVAIVAVSGVVMIDQYNKNNSDPTTKYVYKDGATLMNGNVLIAVWFGDQKYEVEELTKDYKNKKSGYIYFAYRDPVANIVYVSTKYISPQTAEKIMAANNGMFNTYTFNKEDARKIADIGNALQKLINKPIHHFEPKLGYFEHYHTNIPLKGEGKAHSFFGKPFSI